MQITYLLWESSTTEDFDQTTYLNTCPRGGYSLSIYINSLISMRSSRSLLQILIIREYTGYEPSTSGIEWVFRAGLSAECQIYRSGLLILLPLNYERSEADFVTVVIVETRDAIFITVTLLEYQFAGWRCKVAGLLIESWSWRTRISLISWLPCIIFCGAITDVRTLS